MEIKVRAVEGVEEKSVQEVEQELIEKHEEKLNTEVEEAKVEEAEVEETKVEEPSFDDQDVLSFIKEKYDREFKSMDELFVEPEPKEVELPEDVSAFMKFKQETGRGLNDYVKLNQDYDSMDDNTLLKSYYAQTEEGLDSEDIDLLIEDNFKYDEDIDDESDVKRKKLSMKKELAKAKKYLNEQKQKYSAPLESRVTGLSEEDKKGLEEYQQYIKDSKSIQEENSKRTEWFAKKTDEVFGKDFNGFDFKVDDRSFSFAPTDATNLKKQQSDITNFIGKFIDDKGLISDAAGYHRALAVAMNPEKFAKFFYEQGKAEAVEDVSKKSKNIQMDTRQAPAQMSTTGFKVKAMNPSSGRGLKIKSYKKR